jgi:hypothetical protein
MESVTFVHGSQKHLHADGYPSNGIGFNHAFIIGS